MSAAAPAVRPGPGEYAPYYERYVSRVAEGDVVATLRRQIEETLALLGGVSEERAGRGYEPGKWSIKELVGHMVDGERIFAYRALRFARGDRTPLPGFEQNPYVEAGDFNSRTLAIGQAGATNAALLAVAVLANTRPALREKLRRFREEQTARVREAELPS